MRCCMMRARLQLAGAKDRRRRYPKPPRQCCVPRDSVELAAGGVQKDAARQGTGRLIVAYLAAGWTRRAVASALAVLARTISERERAARRDPHPPLGVRIETPPGRREPRLDELAWLRPGQAAQLMGVHVNQLWVWRRAGLLPNTRRTASGAHRYAREDLLAVVRLRTGRKILPAGTAARGQVADLTRSVVAPAPRKLSHASRRVAASSSRP